MNVLLQNLREFKGSMIVLKKPINMPLQVFNY